MAMLARAPSPIMELRTDASRMLGAFLAFARWRAAAAAALIALGSVFDGLSLLFLVPVLNVLIGAPSGGRMAGAAERLLSGYPPSQRLVVLLLGFAGLMVVRSVVLRLRDRQTETLQLEFVEDVRARLVGRLAAAGWPAVAVANHARVVQALSVEIHQVGLASSSALMAAVALTMLVGHGVLALVLAPWIAALAIGSALTAGLLGGSYLVRSKRLGHEIVEAHVGMAGRATALLSGLKLALAQGLEQGFVANYAAASASAVQARVRFHDLQSRTRGLISGAAAITGAVVAFVGIEVLRLPAPVLITLLVVLSRMAVLAEVLQRGVQQVAHNLPAYGAILAVEAELAPPLKRASPAVRSLASPGEEAALVFDRVDYAHEPAPGKKPDIDNASLEIQAGAFVGIVGPSGVGKTTLLDLAAGILTPQSGVIYVFGDALHGEALARHREQLAYVAQDPFLFDDTVRANLRWSSVRSDSDMLQALVSVGAETLLRRLTQGLDTRIGHQGALLSAGERQRLALARAMLRRPRLFLLDEATNAIDPAGEDTALRALSALRPRATILMVAHRHESLRFCDAILEFPGPSFRSAAPLRASQNA